MSETKMSLSKHLQCKKHINSQPRIEWIHGVGPVLFLMILLELPLTTLGHRYCLSHFINEETEA